MLNESLNSTHSSCKTLNENPQPRSSLYIPFFKNTIFVSLFNKIALTKRRDDESLGNTKHPV